jgi:hypothetical protein
MNDIKEFESLLKQHGYDLRSIGVKGAALMQAHALKAIEILENQNIPILGGDVFVLKEKKIDFSYDNWYCDEEDFDNYEEYIRMSWETARKYIKLFKENDNEIYMFQIVIDSRGIGNAH